MFLFRLALALGKTVRELERTMTSRELSEWMAYAQLEGIPDSLWETGLITSAMLNLWSKKRWTVNEVIGRKEPRRRQTADEQFAIFAAIAAAHNARLASARPD